MNPVNAESMVSLLIRRGLSARAAKLNVERAGQVGIARFSLGDGRVTLVRFNNPQRFIVRADTGEYCQGCGRRVYTTRKAAIAARDRRRSSGGVYECDQQRGNWHVSSQPCRRQITADEAGAVTARGGKVLQCGDHWHSLHRGKNRNANRKINALAARIKSGQESVPLSPRQNDLMAHLAEGVTLRTAADRMLIKRSSAETLLQAAYIKLGATGGKDGIREDAIARWRAVEGVPQ